MKTAIAETSAPETTVDCPYCDNHIEIEPAEYGLEDGEQYGAKNLEIEVFCTECKKAFIVNEITY